MTVRWPLLAPTGRVVSALLAAATVFVAATAAGALAYVGRQERLVWADEFTGNGGAAPSSSRWGFDVGANGWGNHEAQCYTKTRENSGLDGAGHLVLTARRAKTTCSDGRATEYTSARLTTRGKHSFGEDGRIVVRASVPVQTGSWPAIWLLGDSMRTVSWPRCGEIDVMEASRRFPGTIQSSVHVANDAGAEVGRTAAAAMPTATRFHTYELRWFDDRLEYAVDGSVHSVVRRESLPSWPFDRPFHLLLNVAVGGTYGGTPDPAASWPARLVVDYVRAYE